MLSLLTSDAVVRMNYFWSLEITLHVLLSPLTGMVDLSDLHLCQWSSSRLSSTASSPQTIPDSALVLSLCFLIPLVQWPTASALRVTY